MYEFLDYQTRDVMTADPVTIGPDASLAELEDLFDKNGFNGVPVLSNAGELLGVVTKLDLLKAFRFTDEHMFPPYAEIMARSVASVMSRDLRSVCPRTPLTRVLEKMVDSGCKSFPVLDADRLVGMIAREDVMRGLRRAASGERARSAEER
jgi:CBS domain-containing protein